MDNQLAAVSESSRAVGSHLLDCPVRRVKAAHCMALQRIITPLVLEPVDCLSRGRHPVHPVLPGNAGSAHRSPHRGLTSPALVQSSRKPCPHDLTPFAPGARHSRTGHAESKGPFSHRRYKSRLLISKGGGPAGDSSFECHRPTATNAGPGVIVGNWRLHPELHRVREAGSEATVWGGFRRRSLLCPPSP